MLNNEELPKCTVHIGDRCYSKKIGDMIPFSVVGIISAANIPIFAKAFNINIERWQMEYPDFLNSWFIIGNYDEPEKIISRDDSVQYINSVYQNLPYFDKMVEAGIIEDMINIDYESAPESKSCYFPMEDCEVIE